MLGLGENDLKFFEAIGEIKRKTIDVIGLFKKLHGMLPILQMEQQKPNDQDNVAASSSNRPTESQEDQFFESNDFLNAYEEFKKDMIKAKKLASAPQSSKDSLYADMKTEELVTGVMNMLKNDAQVEKKELNQQQEEEEEEEEEQEEQEQQEQQQQQQKQQQQQ
ncbi:hypothetical protein M9H77_26463 [Catharanthus roseus]|uniref:Uncharacterized protein n=1 Tax=Catharanthus roseus TaxID=4058 RepID=A0ACC0A9V5_CATRO|nr:hypothetical protein M9H77_26463 [Catharanthus roseus]